jgi:hypothetical protein
MKKEVSMRFFPGSYIVMAAIFLIIGVFTVQNARASETRYMCADRDYHPSCEFVGGYKCMDNAVVSSLLICTTDHGGFVSKFFHMVCGDGVVDVGEQCDDGAYSSDSLPNGCRTNCYKAYCGDGVIDTGEQCDDGKDQERCRDCTVFGYDLSGKTKIIVLNKPKLPPSIGMVDSGKLPMVQQPQGRKKLQPGSFLPGMAKPGAVGGRPNLLPGSQPTIGKPGKPVAPLGTSFGTSTGKGGLVGSTSLPAVQSTPGKVGNPSVPMGTKGMPIAPHGTKSMPPDPLETKKMPPFPLGKSNVPKAPTMSPAPAGTTLTPQTITIVK